MGKLKLAMNLLKLNNKLGLLDLGDVVGLASTAYKVKTFDPTDHLPEFDFLVDKEMERAERRKTMLIAGAVAGVAYLAYKNKDGIASALDSSKSKTKELAHDLGEKGEEAIEKGKDLAEDAIDKGEDIADDVKKKAHEAKDKGEDLAEDAKDKGKDLAHDAAEKAEDLADDAKKTSKKIAKDLED